MRQWQALALGSLPGIVYAFVSRSAALLRGCGDGARVHCWLGRRHFCLVSCRFGSLSVVVLSWSWGDYTKVSLRSRASSCCLLKLHGSWQVYMTFIYPMLECVCVAS